MNLQKLFDAQKKLDDHIRKEKGLEGEDLLDKKILALQVELGECANEFRGFKYWSNDQEPRKGGKCNCDDGYLDVYMGDGVVEQMVCERCNGTYEVPNTLLEEYVDGLHFILSVGNDLKINNLLIDSDYTEETITGTFIEMFSHTSILRDSIKYFSREFIEETYEVVFNLFVGLGKKLGFTWEQVEQAYYAKNKINHERQENGY